MQIFALSLGGLENKGTETGVQKTMPVHLRPLTRRDACRLRKSSTASGVRLVESKAAVSEKQYTSWSEVGLWSMSHGHCAAYSSKSLEFRYPTSFEGSSFAKKSSTSTSTPTGSQRTSKVVSKPRTGTIDSNRRVVPRPTYSRTTGKK